MLTASSWQSTCSEQGAAGDTCQDVYVYGQLGSSRTDGVSQAQNAAGVVVTHYEWSTADGWWTYVSEDSQEAAGGARIARDLGSADLTVGTTASAHLVADGRATHSFDHFWVRGNIDGFLNQSMFNRIRPATGTLVLDGTTYSAPPESSIIAAGVGHQDLRPSTEASVTVRPHLPNGNAPGTTRLASDTLVLDGEFGSLSLGTYVSDGTATGSWAALGDLYNEFAPGSGDFSLTSTADLASGSAHVVLSDGATSTDVVVSFAASGQTRSAAAYDRAMTAWQGVVYWQRVHTYSQLRPETATVTIDGIPYDATGTLTATRTVVVQRQH